MSLGLVRDVLNSKPMQAADMTQAANDIIPYKPGQASMAANWEEESLFTDVAYISSREGKLSLIPTSPRGGPSTQVTPPKSKLIPVMTYRLSEEDQLNASELFKVIPFHTPQGLQNLETVRNQRMAQMADAMDFTFEHLKLNALKGVVKDANSDTLTDLFALFGVTQAAEVAFDLTNATRGTLAKKCATVKRAIYNALEADAARVQHIHVLCSPTFFDDLLANVDILAWASVTPNSQYLQESRVFGTFTWQGFVFEEYRQGTIATTAGATGSWIEADKCVIFPVGPSIYRTFYSPAEGFEDLGTMGIPRYSKSAADLEWNEHIKMRMQSYPLPICLRPLALMKGKKGA